MIKKILKTITIITLLIMSAITLNLFQNYRLMNGWNEHHNKDTPMSEQLPSSIYNQNLNDRQLIMQFQRQYDALYDSNAQELKATISQQKLDQLKETVDKLSNNTSYLELYNQLQQYFNAEKAYQNLFSDYKNGIIKPEVTPKDVQELNATYFNPLIRPLLVKDKQHGFAKRLYQLQELLISDAERITSAISDINNTLVEPPISSLIVNGQAFETDFELIETKLSQLNFKWSNLTKLKGIIEQIKPLIEASNLSEQQFNAYKEDVKKRDEAFQIWQQERQKELDKLTAEYIDELDKIQQEGQFLNQNNSQVVELNDVSGFTKDEIQKWANENNINVKFEYIDDPNTPSGQAVYSDPKAGIEIPISQTITIYIAN